jgi:hypothetical protein
MLFFYAPYFAKFLFSEVMPRLFLCRNLLPSLSLLAFFNANLQDLMQDAAFSFANIAQRLHKSDSTISREIIRNRYQVKTSANHTALCARVNVCTMANLCSTDCNRTSCADCTEVCHVTTAKLPATPLHISFLQNLSMPVTIFLKHIYLFVLLYYIYSIVVIAKEDISSEFIAHVNTYCVMNMV